MSATREHSAVGSNNVLLVDDDPSARRILARWLAGAGYRVRQVGDGQQALLAVEAECPDFLITDWEMPRLDGPGLCRRVREMDLPHYVYVLLVTVKKERDETVAGLGVGADDLLTKPVGRAALLARMRAGRRILQLERRLRLEAHSDPLTGVLTRRTFFGSLAREWERAKRSRAAVSCAMIDIDFFKRVNDVHGHAVGDAVLRAVAQEIARSSRKSDLLCRYGGEEFCVMLPETTEADAAVWAERIRRHVASLEFSSGGVPIRITCSFGIAQKYEDTQNCEQLVDHADQALLCAKRSGRDRVVRFESLGDSGEREIDDRSEYGGLFHGFTASDVMSPVVACLREEEGVGRAAEFFLESRINATPVISSQGLLRGILSEKDLMAALVSPGFWRRPIREFMKPNVISYAPDTPIRTIYEFLCRVAIRRVVVAENERPLGTISRGTLLRWFRNLVLARGRLGSADAGEVPADSDLREPRQHLTATARELAAQVAQLEGHLHTEAGDLVPHVVGGATRMQELLNDLLAHSRCANRDPGGGCRSSSCSSVITPATESLPAAEAANVA